MTVFGLTATGFNPKSFSDCKSELEAAFQGVFGASIDLAPQGPFGQMIGILADRESSVWDAAQEVYASFDPDQATGSSLDSLSALTGTLRNAATHSTVVATITGTAGTTVPTGTQFSVTGTGVKFATLADATFVGTFTTQTVNCQAVETGPLVALAGTLTVIETPVDGLSSVTNALDANLGRDAETDAALRLRREVELRSPANAALEAIREKILALGTTKIHECVVFENTTMLTDADGIPPKAINAVVDVGTATDTEVAKAIFSSVAAGIETYGTDHSTVVEDSQGINHTIGWDSADDVNCYVTETITYDPDKWPLDGSAQALAATLQYEADHLVMGKDLVGRAVGAIIFAISGVLDCVVTVGTAPSPSGASVTIALRQIARLDSSRTVINLVPGTP